MASETSGGEKPICGFRLATGAMCYADQSAPGEGCAGHASLACVGCGAKATWLCSTFVAENLCAAPLCGTCEHKELGPHGPRISPSEIVRQGLIDVAELTLKDASGRGLIQVREGSLRAIASAIIDDQSAHLMMQVLSGMANPR